MIVNSAGYSSRPRIVALALLLLSTLLDVNASARIRQPSQAGPISQAEQKASGPEHKTAKPTLEAVTRELEGHLKQRVAEDQFSGVVLVANHGTPIFKQAYGLANKQYNIPNRIDTKFNLGSINKLFTRISILQLVEQGRLSLDDKLGKHFPDYPNTQAKQSVTIKHLLEMTSGIGDVFGPRFDAIPKNRLRTNSDYLPLFAADPLSFEPGTKQMYSNGGYIVLGIIIEKLTGRSYYDYVREQIFKPASMESSDWYEIDQSEPNLARGYTLRAPTSNGTRISSVYTQPARGSAAGGGYSTAEDLLRFSVALKGNKLLGQTATLGLLSNGLGLAGGAPGISAALEISASGHTVIVLSNYDPPSAMEVSRFIRSRLTQ